MKRTPLYEEHVKLGARMVEFGGWEMPVSYAGIIAEHEAVRNSAGLFDIEHMGVIEITGKDALPLIQKVGTNDASNLGIYQSIYSVICNDQGGAIDDILVYRLSSDYRIVANASNTETVVKWLQENAKAFKAVAVSHNTKVGMLSLQGPAAERITSEISGLNLSDIKKNHCLPWSVRDADLRPLLSRTGYTGEDGFEFFTPIAAANALWSSILAKGILACGLGARDTLRLEAGLPLYGHEYDLKTSPLEVGYGWAIKFNKGDFIGRDALLKQKTEGVKRKLVGLRLNDKAIPRQGCALLDAVGKKIGAVTSGTFSPTLKIPIALGFVPPDQAQPGTNVLVEIRGQKYSATVGPKAFLKKS